MGRTKWLLLLLVVCVAACSGGSAPLPVAPTEEVSAAVETAGGVSSSGNGATVTRGRDSFGGPGETDMLSFCTPGDDKVSFNNYMPYTWQRVVTPSGNSVYMDRLITSEVWGEMIGQQTGFVWHRKHNVAPRILHDEGLSGISLNFHGDWESDNGGAYLKIHESYHANWNAGGKLVVDKYRLSCREK